MQKVCFNQILLLLGHHAGPYRTRLNQQGPFVPLMIYLHWLQRLRILYCFHEPSGRRTLLIENIRKQIKQSIWWVMIIRKQTIYMQIVCNGLSQRASWTMIPASKGERAPGPRITRIKSLSRRQPESVFHIKTSACRVMSRMFLSCFPQKFLK